MTTPTMTHRQAEKQSHFTPLPLTRHELLAKCLDHMRGNDLAPRSALKADTAEYERYSIDRKQSQKDEFYLIRTWNWKGRDYLRCHYGTWTGGRRDYYYYSWKDDEFTNDTDRQAFKADLEKRQKADLAQFEAEEKKKIAKAIEKWGSSSDHPPEDQKEIFQSYLKKKGITGIGIKYGTYSVNLNDEDEEDRPDWVEVPAIVIPLRNIQGELRALQFIYWHPKAAEYQKRFLGRKAGNFFHIGELKDGDKIYISEGYATVESVYTGNGNKPTVMACDCHNLEPVVKALQERYPNSEIIIAADSDEAGRKAAEKVAKARGCRVVYPEFPEGKGKDQNGKSYKDFNDLMQVCGIEEVRRQLLVELQQAEIASAVGDYTLPDGYELDKDGLWYQAPNTGEKSAERICICSPLRVIAIVRDHEGENHRRLLEFEDVDGIVKRWSMPMEMLAGDDKDYRAQLLNKGLIIFPGLKPKQLLSHYIQKCRPPSRVRCVLQTGWCGNEYVLPDMVIGCEQKERLLYESRSTISDVFQRLGTLERWQSQVSALCRGNSRLQLAVSAAFAASLVSKTGEENLGIHFQGPSSTGKTTALRVGRSVFSSLTSVKTWRATSNGIEAIANAHNDSLLCLDEMSEMDPYTIGETVYMLGNGSGKGRADRNCEARKQAKWRLFYLSSGEVGIADQIAEAGGKVKAGQEVRIVNIPADTGRFGIFENLHGSSDGAEFADRLKTACKHSYGTPVVEFLKQFAQNPEAILADINELKAKFMEQHYPEDADGQVIRVFNRFALIAAVGEIATQIGVTGWKMGEAVDGVMRCFQAWVENRGGLGQQEEMQALSQVRKFFEQHGESRFTHWNGPDGSKTINRAGYKRPTGDGLEYMEYYVFTETFRTEICKGLSLKLVEKLMIRDGLLKTESSGKPTRSEKLPGIGTKRVYRVLPNILADGETRRVDEE